MINRPNLFIVGAMKCGTTIMCDFLAEHPDVAIAPAKEIHYFSMHIDKGEEWYLQQFKQDKKVRYTVDASPTYLDTCNSVLIPQLIKSFSPDCKVIILIRDPVERVISHFNHWQKIDKNPRVAGKALQPFLDRDWPIVESGECGDEDLLETMLSFSAYHRKIALFNYIIGANNVLLIHNDDLRRDGQAVMNRVFDFLGVPRIESEGFSKQKYLGHTSRGSCLPSWKSASTDFSDTTISRVARAASSATSPAPASARPTSLSALFITMSRLARTVGFSSRPAAIACWTSFLATRPKLTR